MSNASSRSGHTSVSTLLLTLLGLAALVIIFAQRSDSTPSRTERVMANSNQSDFVADLVTSITTPEGTIIVAVSDQDGMIRLADGASASEISSMPLASPASDTTATTPDPFSNSVLMLTSDGKVSRVDPIAETETLLRDLGQLVSPFPPPFFALLCSDVDSGEIFVFEGTSKTLFGMDSNGVVFGSAFINKDGINGIASDDVGIEYLSYSFQTATNDEGGIISVDRRELDSTPGSYTFITDTGFGTDQVGCAQGHVYAVSNPTNKPSNLHTLLPQSAGGLLAVDKFQLDWGQSWLDVKHNFLVLYSQTADAIELYDIHSDPAHPEKIAVMRCAADLGGGQGVPEREPRRGAACDDPGGVFAGGKGTLLNMVNTPFDPNGPTGSGPGTPASPITLPIIFTTVDPPTITEAPFPYLQPAQAVPSDPLQAVQPPTGEFDADLVGVAVNIGTAGGLDPVLMHNGAFTYDLPLLTIPGVGVELSFDLSYQSRSRYDGPIGKNWIHTYDEHMEQENNSFTILEQGLATHVFEWDASVSKYVVQQRGGETIESILVNGEKQFLRKDKHGNTRTYNIDGHLIEIADRFGNKIGLEYQCGLLVRVEDACGRWLSLSYYESQRVYSLLDYSGRSWFFEYDAEGRLTEVRLPTVEGELLGATRKFTYQNSTDAELANNIATVIDGLQNVVLQNTYDAQDRVVSQQWGTETGTIDYQLAPNGNYVTVETAFDGVVKEYEYDHDLLLVERRVLNPGAPAGEPLVYTWSYSYDADGLVQQEVEPSGIVHEFVYDASGNLTEKKTRPSLSSTTFASRVMTYESQFNLIETEKDELGNVTTFHYDPVTTALHKIDHPDVTVPVAQTASRLIYSDGHGRTTDVWDEESHQTSLEYHDSGPQLGWLKKRTLHLGGGAVEEVQYVYDGLGRVLTVTNPWGGVTTNTWSSRNELLQVERPDGSIWTYEYDANQRLLSKEVPNQLVTGQLINPANPSFETSYLYNSIGKLITETAETSVGQSQARHFSYDPMGRVQTIQVGTGPVGRMERDVRGEVRTRRFAFGTTKETSTVIEWGTDGRQSRRISEALHESEFLYDEWGRIERLSRPGGAYVESSFNLRGDVLGTSTWDSKGTATETDDELIGKDLFLYDERGRSYSSRVLVDSSATPNLYAEATRLFDRRGFVTQAVSPEGVTRSFVYDAAGRRTVAVDGAGNETRWIFAAAQLQSVEQWANRSSGLELQVRTEYEYDQAGNVKTTRKVDVEGLLPSREASASFDSRGLRVGETDEKGVSSSYVFDGLQRLVAVKNGQGTVVEAKSYDSSGFLTQLSDANGNSTIYVYDSESGRLSQIEYPIDPGQSAKVHSIFYDAFGRRSMEVQRNGTIVENLAFDIYGNVEHRQITRATGVLGPDNEWFNYDVMGRLLSATNDVGSGHSVARTYRHDGLTLSETSNGRTVLSGYDLDGRRERQVYPSGMDLCFTYDAAGRGDEVHRQTSTSTFITGADYDGLVISEQVFFNDVVRSDQRNGFLDIESIDYKDSNSGATLLASEYVHDSTGRVSARKQAAEASWEGFAYDQGGRLDSWTFGMPTIDPASAPTDTWTLGLDELSSRETLTHVSSAGSTVENYIDAPENQYQSVGASSHVYDANGNLVSDGVHGFAYDYKNRMVEVVELATGSYVQRAEYGPLGRRLLLDVPGQEGICEFVYSHFGLLGEYRLTSGDTFEYLKASPVGNRSVVWKNNVPFVVAVDDLGSSVAVLDASQGVVERVSYSAWGRASYIDQSGAAQARTAFGLRFGYTGFLVNWSSDFWHAPYRTYSARLGRFLQLDPIGYADGPNRHAYAGGDPINSLDPLGLNWLCKLVDEVVDLAVDNGVRGLSGAGAVLESVGLSNTGTRGTVGFGVTTYSQLGEVVKSAYNPEKRTEGLVAWFAQVEKNIKDSLSTAGSSIAEKPLQPGEAVGNGLMVWAFSDSASGKFVDAVDNPALTNSRTAMAMVAAGERASLALAWARMSRSGVADSTAGFLETAGGAGFAGATRGLLSGLKAGAERSKKLLRRWFRWNDVPNCPWVREITAIGPRSNYEDVADELAANRFKIPKDVEELLTDDEVWELNRDFLDDAIERGDDFYLTTPADEIAEGSFLEREVTHLIENGYEFVAPNRLSPGGQ